ncbi:hypothetical protein D3C71_1674850 [compost metagenome]
MARTICNDRSAGRLKMKPVKAAAGGFVAILPCVGRKQQIFAFGEGIPGIITGQIEHALRHYDQLIILQNPAQMNPVGGGGDELSCHLQI